jgi:hypothetical protein
MKRFTALLIVVLTIVLGAGMLTALAASASAAISGPDSVAAGGTYTYTYQLNVSAACAANLNVTVGGVFEKVSGGDGLFHDSIPDNTSASYTGTVTVKVKADAAPGDKGTISASGAYSYLDEAYNESSGPISKSFSATVTATSSPSATVTPPAATKTPKPSTAATSTPSATATLTPTPGLAGWTTALDDVNAMAQGGTVTVTLPENAQLPAELLAVLKAKSGRLIVDFGSYICIIDGQTLGGAADMPLNLTLLMDKDAALSVAAGGADVFQLHFAHEGELPGPVIVSLEAAGYSPGDTLYLYYYYASSGATEFRQSATVGEDGRINFVIYHCSAYYVTASAPDTAAGVVAPVAAPTLASTPAATQEGSVAAAVPNADSNAGGYSLTTLLLTAVVALIVGGGSVFLVLRLPAARKKTRSGRDDMDL